MLLIRYWTNQCISRNLEISVSFTYKFPATTTYYPEIPSIFMCRGLDRLPCVLEKEYTFQVMSFLKRSFCLQKWSLCLLPPEM